MKNLSKFSLWFLVGLVSLGELQKVFFSLNHKEIGFYLSDSFILAFNLFLLFFINKKYINLKEIKDYVTKNIFDNHKYIFKIFIIFVFTTTFFNIIINKDSIQLLYLIRFFNIIFFALQIYLIKKQEIVSIKTLKAQLLAFNFLLLYLGFGQLFFFSDTRFLFSYGYDDHYQRMIGTLFDPAFLGINLIFGFYISLFSRVPKIIKVILLTAFALGIFLTISRASYLAFLISLIFLFVHHKEYVFKKINFTKAKLLLFLSTFFLATTILLSLSFTLFTQNSGEGRNIFRTSSILARFKTISAISNSISMKELVIGNGLFSSKNNLENRNVIINQSPILNNAKVPDNIFLNILISSGAIGLLLFITLVAKQLISQPIALTQPVIYFCFLALLISAQFNNTVFHNFTMLNFLWIVGLYKLDNKSK